MDCFHLASDNTKPQTASHKTKDPTSELISHLEHNTSLLVDAVNQRNFTYGPDVPPHKIHPGWRNIIPSFTAEPEYHSKVKNLKDLLRLFQKITHANPDFRLTVLDITSDAHVDEGAVDVFLQMRTTGFPVGVVRHSVAILKWRLLRKAEWKCVAYEGIAGNGL